MKNNIYRFCLLLMSLMTATTFVSCGDDNDNDPPSKPAETLLLVQQSIAENAVVEASDVGMLTLTYNKMVKVSPSVSITVNGASVAASVCANNVMAVEIPLSLVEDASYVVKVGAGAVVYASDASVKAPEFTLRFTTAKKPEPTSNDATALAKRLGWGWNLGNHFDTSSDADGKHPQWGYWDNATPTATLYTNLKKAGASTVRICTTWGNYQETESGNWTIEADYMAEVKQNVEWAEQAGLNVILNLHHDEYWLKIKDAANNSGVNENIKTRIEKTWQQIAETFKDKGDFLFFETFNEVQDGQWGWGANRTDGGKQYRTLNEWNQLVVNTIRATGGNNATRWIGVPAYASNGTFALDNSFVLPTDAANRIMVSVHFYDPSNFTLTPYNDGGKSEWGHSAAAGKSDAGNNENHVVELFSKLQEKYIANNIPVYIGEYGCVMHTNDRSNLFRNYYLEYVCRAAHTFGMPLIIWDNNATGGGNEHHGYFNHNDGTYLNDAESLVKTMIKAATSDDDSYTLETIYNTAP